MSKLYSLFLQHPVITTDSRDCPVGSIFFALKGANFNGNAYAASALEKGCAFAVVDEPQYAIDDRFVLVEDVLTALQQLANEHRRALGTPVIGVTGTNGKTTTKELIAAVLSEKYNVLFTQGNFNNHIGVPKTLLQLRPEHDIAVIEMGANHPGEIKTLVDIVEPDCGIITNVGKAHLEGFGSFEGVIRTKGELYDFLRTKCEDKKVTHSSIVKGTVFIHADNEYLLGISNDLPLVRYGVDKTEECMVVGRVEECAPFLSFSWKCDSSSDWNMVKTHLIGTYNIYNMVAAATIGLNFGVTEEQVCHALANYIPSNNRSQLTITEHNKLIVDTYNANPTSMMAALSNFRDMKVAPKMAILGDMRELGEVSAEEHQKVVDFLKLTDIDTVWLVGPEFSKTDCGLSESNDVESNKADCGSRKFNDVELNKADCGSRNLNDEESSKADCGFRNLNDEESSKADCGFRKFNDEESNKADCGFRNFNDEESNKADCGFRKFNDVESNKADCGFRKFNDVEEVKVEINKMQPSDHYILIKGSNGIKLFQLPELL